MGSKVQPRNRYARRTCTRRQSCGEPSARLVVPRPLHRPFPVEGAGRVDASRGLDVAFEVRCGHERPVRRRQAAVEVSECASAKDGSRISRSAEANDLRRRAGADFVVACRCRGVVLTLWREVGEEGSFGHAWPRAGQCSCSCQPQATRVNDCGRWHVLVEPRRATEGSAGRRTREHRERITCLWGPGSVRCRVGHRRDRQRVNRCDAGVGSGSERCRRGRCERRPRRIEPSTRWSRRCEGGAPAPRARQT
jgi:hypothetical protein